MKSLNKTGEIHRGNASILKGIVLGIVFTGFMICFNIWLLGLNILTYLQEDKIWEVLLILPTMLTAFVVHEFIHVCFFILFGQGKARIKISRDKSIGAIIMHQTNENVYYKRWQMIIILLSPLVILTVFFLLLNIVISMPYLIFVNIVLNAMGSSVDLYVSLVLLSKRESELFINFDSKTVKMNLYSPS